VWFTLEPTGKIRGKILGVGRKKRHGFEYIGVGVQRKGRDLKKKPHRGRGQKNVTPTGARMKIFVFTWKDPLTNVGRHRQGCHREYSKFRQDAGQIV